MLRHQVGGPLTLDSRESATVSAILAPVGGSGGGPRAASSGADVSPKANEYMNEVRSKPKLVRVLQHTRQSAGFHKTYNHCTGKYDFNKGTLGGNMVEQVADSTVRCMCPGMRPPHFR